MSSAAVVIGALRVKDKKFCMVEYCVVIQSTLVISKSKGPSETLRDIRTSTYQICSIEEKIIRTTKFYK